jgi:lysophospholipase L1-like esterase
MKYSAAFRTSAVALISAIAVALCSCADVTSSQESSEVRSETATTAKTSISTTSATTVAATTKAVTTSVTTVAATNETTLPETKTVATEPEPEPEPTEPVETPEPVSVAEPTAPTDFDTSFFDDSLFIGDSITTGLYLYGYLDPSLVYAMVGLAPSTALDSEIDGKTIDSKIKSNNPKKIYIMLGTNSVGYADGNYLADCMGELVQHISKVSKAKVYVLSIPPITYYAEADYDNALTTSAINEYNSALEKVISGTKAEFLDLHSVLTAPDGYYYEEYHEMDGIHFMGSTYQVMLSFLEKHS